MIPIGQQLADVQAAANILGRMTVLREAKRKVPHAPLRFSTASSLITFADAPQQLAKAQDATIYTSFDLPPTGAAEYIRSLTPVSRQVFDGLSAQYRADAFSVANIADTRILTLIQAELGDVIQSGGVAKDFRAAVAGISSDEGIERLSGDMLDNVFAGLSHKAYQAGRWEQLTDGSVAEALPFWQYWTVGDDRVRPEHAVLDHFAASVDDPVWRKIYPPCGYGCRCSVVPITEDDAPDGSEEPGMLRLPALAEAKVPQPGFQTIFG